MRGTFVPYMVLFECATSRKAHRRLLHKRIARILFAVEGGLMVLLHGFIKKTQRTQNDDIKLAEKRFKEWYRDET